MKQWPVERQILAGFAVALALLAAMGALVHHSSRTMVETHRSAQRSQQALTALARRQNRRLSEVVRELLQQQLNQLEADAEERKRRGLEALARIQEHREAILARRGGEPLPFDPTDLIEQMREERDAEISGMAQ